MHKQMLEQTKKKSTKEEMREKTKDGCNNWCELSKGGGGEIMKKHYAAGERETVVEIWE